MEGSRTSLAAGILSLGQPAWPSSGSSSPQLQSLWKPSLEQMYVQSTSCFYYFCYSLFVEVLLGLASGVQSSYALLVGEVCPNKYKWLGIMFVIVLAPIPTGFGNYLGESDPNIWIRNIHTNTKKARMLVENANWRWVYYIQIIMLVFTLGLQIVFYKPPNFRQLHGERTVMQELKRVDWVGIFLLVSGLLTFLLGISWGKLDIPFQANNFTKDCRWLTRSLEFPKNNLSVCCWGLFTCGTRSLG
jgi:hypothetical protein